METRQVSEVEREMRALVADQKASGQSLAQFADARGVPRWKLYDWRRKIEQRDVREATRARFAAVRVVDAPDEPAVRPHARVEGASIEIVLRGGRTLTLRGDVDGEQLKRVVLALEAC